MATVNLGKIKLKWRGTWSSGGSYTADDVVEYTDGSVTSSFIAVASSSNQAPSSGGTVNTTYWNLAAKGQATSPTTTQGDLIVRGASADGRLGVGAAGQVLKVNSSGNGLEYGTGSKVLQIKHASKTDVQFFGAIAQGAETTIPFVASITPASASSKLLVQMMITCDMNTTHGTFATAKKTTGGVTTEPAVGDTSGSRHRVTTGTSDNSSSTLRNIHIMFVDTAGTTNQIDYGFTLSHMDNSTVEISLNYSCASDTNASYTGRGMSSITVTEFTD